eukprot:gene24091-32507_t
MPSATGRARVSMDMKDLDGLRGVAAIWIVFFHSFYYSSLGFINLQGSTLMPLFFLLSGFALTVGYRSRLLPADSNTLHHLPQQVLPDEENTSNPLLESSTIEKGTTEQPTHPVTDERIVTNKSESNQPSPFPVEKLKNYFYNRLIRVLPVYYICMVIAIPPNLAGWANVNPANTFQVAASFITNIIPVNTWFIFLLGAPFDGPSWTICTLLFFWMVFPWLLRYYDRYSDEQLLYAIVRMYWIQALLVSVVWIILLVSGVDSFVSSFWLVTGFPPARLPVFIMGICASLLCSRHASSATMPWFTNSYSFIPLHLWNCAWCCGPWCWKVGITAEVNQSEFARIVPVQILQILSLTIAWVILGAATTDFGSNAWFQGLNVFSQLTIIIGLVRLNGPSLCSVVLRHPITLWFGEISMSLYLVHEMIVYYIRWIMHHGESQKWPSCADDSTACQNDWNDYKAARQYPAYLIPIILPIATIISACFYYGVEEPVRKYFK